MLNTVVQLLVNGIAMGMIYALMSMGLILLVRAVGVLNFAQGDLLMLGAFAIFQLTMQMEVPLWAAFIIALIFFLIAGAVFMFTCYWPVRSSKWTVAVTVCTIGASMVIKEAAKLIWGGSPLPVDPLAIGVFEIGPISIEKQYLIIILVAAFMIALVFTIFEKLYSGKLLQAAAQDPYAAQLLGIPPVITTMVTYMIVMVIVGFGGALVAPIFLASVNLASLQLRAFAGAIIGGFGNLKGAILGSLFIGIIEAFSIVITSTYKDAIVFLIMLIFLVVRPQGIFGEKVADKA
ncbi:branched-chain amino acid ABC transporter permease [Clostridium sp. AL.422]|uniref:branched-chain amino acid ABC transporter permease n=1 Tax=Clostridium TaxID=1485 RepID=UPI00293DBA34|nr:MULTISPECIES: branched-chain amino acid ABC transporter permease [unclassified Clostridium]MDV4150464.1 branched-chain amino acid ABC transporter permease [Clostridium sp. AL.422]